MTRIEYDNIVKSAKKICIILFQICFFGSIIAGFTPYKYWLTFAPVIWFFALIPYVTHTYIVDFFIKKVLKIKVED